MTALTLRRATSSRPEGQWDEDDYDVFSVDRLVGRIFRGVGGVAKERPWIWSITIAVPQWPDDRGHAESREAAMAAFKARWEARLANG